MFTNIDSQQWSIRASRKTLCHKDLLIKRNYLSKKSRFIQTTDSQRKNVFKKSDWRNKIIMNCFSTSSWKIYFWCRTNDHLRRCIKHVLIEEAQFHNRLKTRIFEIRAMWLRYHNSIYASTSVTNDSSFEQDLLFELDFRTFSSVLVLKSK